jgi:hypothetical protein
MPNARFILVAFAALLAAPVFGQPTAAQQQAIRNACRGDFQANCSGVSPGGQAALACLQQNASRLSAACRQAVAAVSGGGAATPAAPAAAAASAAAPQSAQASARQPITPPANTWPHTYSGPNGSAIVYQPQVISWPEHKTLNARAAIGITPTGAKAPILGTIDLAFATETSLVDRTVTLTDARLVAARFPSASPEQAARFEQGIKSAIANMGVKQVPLPAIVMSLRQQAEKPPEVALDNKPPRIFVANRAASLVVFDGEPVMTPIAGTPLAFAVNTNWDVFSDSSTKTWYLLNNGSWMGAPAATGPWSPAGQLPPSFAALPNDANFADVKKAIPGKPLAARDAPTIFVSTTPAEIIVLGGVPQWVAVRGTSLQYANNTDAALFREMRTGTVYYLVSGRWFSAPGLEGPWTFATPNLPPDFARIPADGPRGFVLVSVPGTPQAQEALIEAQIPQQATLNRSTAKLEVVYAGAPQFVAIAGTPMMYATNTSFAVIQTGEGYFSCYQGAWFMATGPSGPWVLATTVPPAIYTIPPSSPVYPCTYVRVYASTPEVVTYGYTAGYTMGYVSAGVVVYGTGYYYPPYIYPAPIPIYYPYPYSYSGATYYNSATGAWAQGGAIYGPYGGVAKAGYAYNPTTGAWAQGGAIYGPNGGAGAFSAYNPTTGSYAHGSAVWGPNGASGNASWYNANTGRTGSTTQGSNAYGRWGSTTISGPNQTVHMQSQSNAQGSAGSFSSSSGAKGAAVSGAGGNTAGAVKTASGNVYAGADGNVYKKTDNGWEKYDNGSWNQVQKPPTQNNANATRTTQGQTPTAQGQSTSGANTAQQRQASQGATQQTDANRSNLSGATQQQQQQQRSETMGSQQRMGASQSEGSGRSEGFNQLEQDHQARFGGAQRQQQFESMRGGGAGGFAGRGGGGGGFRR